ncbi:MAG: BamA/TamA family outer membrane protein [Bacteroidales bacterium]|nr:BamA/TamA family outer membrane protein [Bacteroidales bacterium]
MKRGFTRFATLVVSAAVMLGAVSSCGTTRSLGEDDYILKKNTIRILNSTSYPAGSLSGYLKQEENRSKLFGSVRRRTPVLLNDDLIGPSCNDMLRHIEYTGYYGSTIDTTVIRRNHKAKVFYNINLGRQIPIKSTEFIVEDSRVRRLLDTDTAPITVKPGMMLSEEMLDAQSEQLAQHLRNNGFYGFSKNYLFHYADTTTVPDSVLLRVELKNRTRNEPENVYTPHRQYTIRDIRTDYPPRLRLRDDFLQGINPLHQGEIYSEEAVGTAYRKFTSLRLFNTVNINMTPADSTEVDCRISLTPSRLQSYTVNMEASTNSTGLIGLSPSVSYNHLNLFGGGENLSLGFRGNFQFKIKDPARSNEFAISSALTFPKMLLIPGNWKTHPTIPSTEIALSYNYQNRPEYTRNILSSSFGYIWSTNTRLSSQLNPILLSITKMFDMDPSFYENLTSSYLRYQYQDHFDLGASATFYYTTNPKVMPKESYFYMRYDVSAAGDVLSLAGNVFGSIFPTNSNGERLIWNIPFSQYFRNQITLVETLRFGKEQQYALAGRFLGGIGLAHGNSHSLPLEQMFYAGGANSMRGWQSRTVGPGKSPLDSTFAIFNQTGDMRLEANIEFRFPLGRKLQGVLFTDVGNVWNLPKKGMENDAAYQLSVFSLKTLAESTAVSWGTGARLDFGILLVRIDLGLKAYDPCQGKWLTPKEWLSPQGYALHLGIGYPF